MSAKTGSLEHKIVSETSSLVTQTRQWNLVLWLTHEIVSALSLLLTQKSLMWSCTTVNAKIINTHNLLLDLKIIDKNWVDANLEIVSAIQFYGRCWIHQHTHPTVDIKIIDEIESLPTQKSSMLSSSTADAKFVSAHILLLILKTLMKTESLTISESLPIQKLSATIRVNFGFAFSLYYV